MTDKELAHKRKNIAETVKITKAMQTVSSAMIIPLEKKRDLAKNYLDRVSESVALFGIDLPATKGGLELIISIAGDKGLCGDFNNSVIHETEKQLQAATDHKLYPIGMLLSEYFRDKSSSTEYVGLAATLNAVETHSLAVECLESFLKGEVSSVRLIYVEGKSRSVQEVRNELLLPNAIDNKDNDSILLGSYNSKELLVELITAKLYYALCSSEYALNCKRFVTMKQATENGEKMENELRIAFNRARQNKITNELNDSVAANLGKRL